MLSSVLLCVSFFMVSFPWTEKSLHPFICFVFLLSVSPSPHPHISPTISDACYDCFLAVPQYLQTPHFQHPRPSCSNLDRCSPGCWGPMVSSPRSSIHCPLVFSQTCAFLFPDFTPHFVHNLSSFSKKRVVKCFQSL